MPFPEFFDAAPRFTVRDPLADFLGAADDGVIEYGYADVVKLAGHSCPTVASAYLMTRAALGSLYPEVLPERGGIRVELRDDRLEGATGVVANVASFLTGATHDTGFKGIGGHFDRRNCCSSASTSRGSSVSRALIPALPSRCPLGSTACPPIHAWSPSCSVASQVRPRPPRRRVSNRCGKAGSVPWSLSTPTIRTSSSFNTEVIHEKHATDRSPLLFPCARVAMTFLTIPDVPGLRDWQAPTEPHLALEALPNAKVLARRPNALRRNCSITQRRTRRTYRPTHLATTTKEIRS